MPDSTATQEKPEPRQLHTFTHDEAALLAQLVRDCGSDEEAVALLQRAAKSATTGRWEWLTKQDRNTLRELVEQAEHDDTATTLKIRLEEKL